MHGHPWYYIKKLADILLDCGAHASCDIAGKGASIPKPWKIAVEQLKRNERLQLFFLDLRESGMRAQESKKT
jgi:hypothetical protein